MTEQSTDQFDYCVEFTAENNSNIKMEMQGVFDFTAGLAGRTIAFVDGAIVSYRINGVDTPCFIPLTHNTTKVFFEEDSLPAVTNRVATSITFTIDMSLNTSEVYYINGSRFAIVTPGTQMSSFYTSCD